MYTHDALLVTTILDQDQNFWNTPRKLKINPLLELYFKIEMRCFFLKNNFTIENRANR